MDVGKIMVFDICNKGRGQLHSSMGSELQFIMHYSNHKYFMLKFNSKGLIINDIDPALKQHLEKLVEKSQQTVKEKLQRQLEKEARVEAVQRQFMDWAERKEERIKEKLEKCSRNKEDHLSKIVKKCKEHEKFIGERLKNYQSKKKASLREAWKKAEKYKNEVEDKSSKNVSKEKSAPKVKEAQDLAYSQMIHLDVDRNQTREYLSTYNGGNMSKVYGNASKDYWAELNQSVKQLKVSEHIQFLDELQEKMEDKAKMGDKLKETLARFKQNTFDSQQTRIQQLGQRLEKIERSRLRKFQLVKKKREKHQTVNDDDSQVRMAQKKKVDRSERIHSETMMREKRVRDWSQMNKNKRMQVFQANLQNGTEYLESQKIKYLKASLAKKITLSAIEKKLYFERLNH